MESCLIKTIQTQNGSKQVIDWRSVKNLPPSKDKSNFFDLTELKLPEESKYDVSDLDEENWSESSPKEPNEMRTQDTVLRATQEFINTPIPAQWRM